MIRTDRAQTGFTLMELIGVMAVIAIMAGVIAPSVFDTITRAYGDAEEENIKGIAENLIRYINENKRIPSQNINDWVTSVAAYSDLSRDKIEFNARNFRRRIYIDPRFFSGSDTVFSAYTQSTGLSQAPVSPRIMVVSDLTGNVPNPPTTNAAFSAIWDQTGGASVVEGDKVKVQRIHLAENFHRLILVNSNTQQPAYNLEAASAASVPNASGGIDGTVTLYVLHNSRLGLYADPYPAGALTTVSMIKQEQAYHYKTDGTAWYWEQL